ncbi:hypothetical protein PhCBS80983_g04462 [Powellomyces hirtus]|uniref:G-protein coupled receptors family 1 profile domain-containing protein n=1 Tax=Powellomyces hirtus TaxID=109895 RepID=A0A507DXV5_9FUNG|nr:hypothetical protein PhCBS80983_g04462 [Powellomyces hirtus]
MSLLITTFTALTISHTIVYLNTLLGRTELATRIRIPLILMCLTHIIQRMTMMFYFDPTLTRNCTALIVIGNLFGEIAFRYTLLYMLALLFRTMRKEDIASKAVAVVSFLLWLGSSIAFMEHMITAPIIDHAVCQQILTPWKTTVNNTLFLLSFTVVALPIILHLSKHLRDSRMVNRSSSTVDGVYYRQLIYIVVFTVSYIVLVLAQWFISPSDWGWLMMDFILCDYIWLNGIQLWTFQMSADGPSAQRKSDSLSNKESKNKLAHVPNASAKFIKAPSSLA